MMVSFVIERCANVLKSERNERWERRERAATTLALAVLAQSNIRYFEIPSRFDILLLTCGTLLPLSISVWNFIGHAPLGLRKSFFRSPPASYTTHFLGNEAATKSRNNSSIRSHFSLCRRLPSSPVLVHLRLATWSRLILALIAAYEGGHKLCRLSDLRQLLTFILANILNIPCSPNVGVAASGVVIGALWSGRYGPG